jgi:hypothetical protein
VKLNIKKMSIEEIKERLGIDITEKNRTDLYVYLRSIYYTQEKGKKTITAISRDLKLTHSSLINAFSKQYIYESDPLYHLVVKAYVTEDKKYITEYLENFKERRLNRSRADYLKSKINIYEKFKIEKPIVIEVEKPVIFSPKLPRESLFIVCEKLRNKKTYLKDKYFNAWTDKDWIKYYEL